MTEVDILNSLMFCEHKDCETCSRDGSENCEKQLIRDARTAIKMQIDCIKYRDEEIEELKAERTRLTGTISRMISEDDIVDDINGIVNACFDGKTDLNGEEYSYLVSKMLDLAKRFRSSYKVSITGFSDAPRIEKR